MYSVYPSRVFTDWTVPQYTITTACVGTPKKMPSSTLMRLVILWFGLTNTAVASTHPTYSSMNMLPVDERNNLDQNLLVVSSSSSCDPVMAAIAAHWNEMNPFNRAERGFAFADSSLASNLDLDDKCGRAVCLERGTPLGLASHPLHRYIPTTQALQSVEGTVDELFQWFQEDCQSAEIGFVSCATIRFVL